MHYKELKRYAEALAAFEEAITRDPIFAMAHYNKGNVLNALGRAREAEQAFARAKELGYIE